MSGGSLDYFYCELQDHAGDLGDRELNELISDLAELFHDREWFLSGDTSEGSWNKAKKEFKEKWFTEVGRTQRFDKYINEAVTELRSLLQIEERFCKDCMNWKKDDVKEYGRCKDNTWLTHGYEHACDEYKPGRDEGK